MKITIDKDFTPISRLKDLKAAIKDFKARYTDNDLVAAYQDAFDVSDGYGYDVLHTDISAFWDNATRSAHYSVNIILWLPRIAFVTYHFYCNPDGASLNISEDSVLRDTVVYRNKKYA